MSLRTRTLGGVGWSFVQNWGREAVSLLVFVMLARLLAPDAFGLVALATVFVTITRVFVDQGFSTALIQRRRLTRAHRDTAFWAGLGFGALFTALGIAVAEPAAALLGEPRLAAVLRWLSLTFVISGVGSVPNALFRRRMAFRTLAVRDLTATCVGGCVGVGMALAGFGVWSLVGMRVVEAVVTSAIVWWAVRWRPGLRVSAAAYRDLIGFGASMSGSALLTVVSTRADDLLIGTFLGPTALGYYSVAYRVLRTLWNLLYRTFSGVSTVVFSKLADDPERVRSTFYRSSRHAFTLTIPLFMGLAAVAPELVPVVFGARWAPSIPIMQVLMFMGVVSTLNVFTQSVTIGLGKPHWFLARLAADTIGNVVAFAVVVHLGIMAVALALVARAYLFIPIPLYQVRKLAGIRFRGVVGETAVPVAASAVMVAAVFGVRAALDGILSPAALLPVLIAAGAFAYVSATWLISPSRARETVAMGLAVFGASFARRARAPGGGGAEPPAADRASADLANGPGPGREPTIGSPQ